MVTEPDLTAAYREMAKRSHKAQLEQYGDYATYRKEMARRGKLGAAARWGRKPPRAGPPTPED